MHFQYLENMLNQGSEQTALVKNNIVHVFPKVIIPK